MGKVAFGRASRMCRNYIAVLKMIVPASFSYPNQTELLVPNIVLFFPSSELGTKTKHLGGPMNRYTQKTRE